MKSVGDKQSKKNASKKEELTISSIDFVGLEFSDKRKSRGLPAGLVPMTDTFPEGELPEVEIIIGDSTKFGDAAAASKPMPTKEEDADLYKPKVSTWGLFPRPNNISKSVRYFSLLGYLKILFICFRQAIYLQIFFVHLLSIFPLLSSTCNKCPFSILKSLLFNMH